MKKLEPSTHAVAHLPLEKLRSCLQGLTEFCPVDRCNPVDCPLFNLRTMDPVERLRWFNALEPADLNYLAAYHQVCMAVRLESHQVSQEPHG